MRKKRGNTMNKFWAKGFVMLLAVMLFFTVVSRAADSFLVARVTVENYSAKKIEHIVSAEARVQKNLEFPVMTEAGLLVRTVYVQEGETVEEGDVLAEIDLGQLAEETEKLRDEIKVLKLQNEALSENQAQAQEEKEKQRQRAREDYGKALREKEEAECRAAEELQQAEDAIDGFTAGGTGSAAASMTQEEREAKKAELWQTYFAKKQAYEDVKSSGEDNVTAAERALEDADTENTADYSKEINDISIAGKEKILKAYEQIAESGGKISADAPGTVTGVMVGTGQKTADTAAFTIASMEGGVRLLAELSKEDARYVEQGDAVTVEKNGKKYEEFFVSGMKQKENGGLELNISSKEDTDIFQMGEGVKITITKQSQVYAAAVPLTAIHTEQNGNYVYVAEQKETVLGKQYFTRKVEVHILEKNSEYAALEEGLLSNENLIVIDSDTYIQAGDRVRLQEP